VPDFIDKFNALMLQGLMLGLWWWFSNRYRVWCRI